MRNFLMDVNPRILEDWVEEFREEKTEIEDAIGTYCEAVLVDEDGNHFKVLLYIKELADDIQEETETC